MALDIWGGDFGTFDSEIFATDSVSVLLGILDRDSPHYACLNLHQLGDKLHIHVTTLFPPF